MPHQFYHRRLIAKTNGTRRIGESPMACASSSLPSGPDGQKRRVCYYYDSGIANVDYGPEHCMVPRRVDMAHALVRSYGLLGDMRRLRETPATEAEVLAVHSSDYVKLLQKLTPKGFLAADADGASLRNKAKTHGVGTAYDNPGTIAGLWNYCQRYAGGSLAAARALASGEADVAINWSGGMHHACAHKASGFCYVNDITLAIYRLLDRFRRVLYLDIDVHHGDGVQAAFAESNRVMTISFHQFTEEFFPGTGCVHEVGSGAGKYHAINVPMMAGMDDDGYSRMFEPIMKKVMGAFQPEAVVMQCGADSLSGDRLGKLNLSIEGHARCVGLMRGFNVPLLLLGGGGYTINHVAACWCYETAVAVGKQIDNDIPYHCYNHYYMKQGYKLHYPVQRSKNGNNESYITDTTNKVLQHLSMVEAAPSVQFHDPKAEGSIDDLGDLFYDSPPVEDVDPLERLHRLCGQRDVRSFLIKLGKRRWNTDSAKETDGPEVVKKYTPSVSEVNTAEPGEQTDRFVTSPNFPLES